MFAYPFTSYAIVHGLIWSILWAIALLIIFHFYPQALFHDYPKEIQAIAQKPEKGTESGRRILTVAVTVILMGYFLFSILWTFRNNPSAFFTVVGFAFIVFMMWNLFDLLILDWLLFCTIQPKFMVLPGTEGHPAYRDYWFHCVGFLKGIGLSAAFALALGGLAYGALNFIIW